MLGEEHLDTLTSIANLALIYNNQGRWREAEELQAKELNICSRVLGEEHPDTLTSITNLASTYRDQGRWKEAEELDMQVIKTRKRVLGEEHPDILTNMANLALTYSKQGQWKEAEKLGMQVLETSSRVLGKEHRDTSQYGQPSVDVQQTRPMEGGRRTGGTSSADRYKGAWGETSRHVNRHEQPRTYIKAPKPQSRGHLDNAKMLPATETDPWASPS